MDIKQKKFLIIAGQPKAGTTSLFEWLKDHPSICASRLKETRFFMDDDYPLIRPMGFDGDNIDKYLDLFDDADREILMEASPDYLFCKKPLLIAEHLPKAKIVVIVREPVGRMISAFRYFQQRGLVDAKVTFDEYIDRQMTFQQAKNTPIQYRALEQCRVDYYLSQWREVFGDRLLVFDFKELAENPAKVLLRIAELMNIDNAFFSEKSFLPKNETFRTRSQAVARIYYAVNRKIAMLSLRIPAIKIILRPIGNIIKPMIQSAKPIDRVEVSESTAHKILEFAAKK